jgi:Family of unknown function (DUF6166)
MRTYSGARTIDGILVTVDGRPLEARLDLATFSASGFEWSYEGREPSQLAFALLFDHLGDATEARTLTDKFMRTVVANFDNDWLLTSSDVASAVGRLRGSSSC